MADVSDNHKETLNALTRAIAPGYVKIFGEATSWSAMRWHDGARCDVYIGNAGEFESPDAAVAACANYVLQGKSKEIKRLERSLHGTRRKQTIEFAKVVAAVDPAAAISLAKEFDSYIESRDAENWARTVIDHDDAGLPEEAGQ